MENKISRQQLNTLWKSFDCITWRVKISELAMSTDLEEIVIPDDYINLLKKEGTKAQIELITKEYPFIIFPQEKLSITDRVKTFEDALALVSATDVEKYILAFNDQSSYIASVKLSIICRALNEGWTPDWSNSDQYKYYPWFRFDGSSGRWSCLDYVFWFTHSAIGSRLVLKSEKLAEYCGKTFATEWNQMFNL